MIILLLPYRPALHAIPWGFLLGPGLLDLRSTRDSCVVSDPLLQSRLHHLWSAMLPGTTKHIMEPHPPSTYSINQYKQTSWSTAAVYCGLQAWREPTMGAILRTISEIPIAAAGLRLLPLLPGQTMHAYCQRYAYGTYHTSTKAYS